MWRSCRDPADARREWVPTANSQSESTDHSPREGSRSPKRTGVASRSTALNPRKYAYPCLLRRIFLILIEGSYGPRSERLAQVSGLSKTTQPARHAFEIAAT